MMMRVVLTLVLLLFLTAISANEELKALYTSGDLVQLRERARTLIQDPARATSHVYQYLGVAQYALGDLPTATKTFEEAVRVYPNDAQNWIHLANCYLYQLQIAKAAAALEVAIFEKNATHEVHRLSKVRNWMADWQDREEMLQRVQAQVELEIQRNQSSDLNALDFANLPAPLLRQLSRLTQQVDVPDQQTTLWAPDQALSRPQPLRIGFVSSDFGVHPVVQLMRGLLAELAKDRRDDVVVYCFSLTTATSWWKRNITRSVDYMVSLSGKNAVEAATIIHTHQIHVLIDLNGHTLHSGLPILRYRPAPIQLSFLGYPMTTGAPFIDYFVSDLVSTPAESSAVAFSEKLVLLPTHYIANDYLQMLGHTIEGPRPLLRQIVKTSSFLRQDPHPFVFGTFSNWQKMDPPTFRTWMEILQRVPRSVMWFLRYSGHQEAEKHLREEAKALGVDGDTRLLFSDLAPWINHTFPKRAVDLVLDTTLKNGHTTILDALWAGVPVVTLEGGKMSNRAASSALQSLGMARLPVHSLKEYVETAVRLATHPPLLQRLRHRMERHRLMYPLFDTQAYSRHFLCGIRTLWQVRRSSNASMHVFWNPDAMKTNVPTRELVSHAVVDDKHVEDEYEVQVREAQGPIKLHIGGQARRNGWWIVDANDRNPHVDLVMDMANLYAFPDNSVSAIYASHVLEHCHYGLTGEVSATLREWFRVLRPGGLLLVAVPDLLTLSAMFADENTSNQDRFFIMRMMFGGQVDV